MTMTMLMAGHGNGSGHGSITATKPSPSLSLLTRPSHGLPLPSLHLPTRLSSSHHVHPGPSLKARRGFIMLLRPPRAYLRLLTVPPSAVVAASLTILVAPPTAVGAPPVDGGTHPSGGDDDGDIDGSVGGSDIGDLEPSPRQGCSRVTQKCGNLDASPHLDLRRVTEKDLSDVEESPSRGRRRAIQKTNQSSSSSRFEIIEQLVPLSLSTETLTTLPLPTTILWLPFSDGWTDGGHELYIRTVVTLFFRPKA